MLTQLCWPSGRRDLGFGLVGLAEVDVVGSEAGVLLSTLGESVAVLAWEVQRPAEELGVLHRVIEAC